MCALDVRWRHNHKNVSVQFNEIRIVAVIEALNMSATSDTVKVYIGLMWWALRRDNFPIFPNSWYNYRVLVGLYKESQVGPKISCRGPPANMPGSCF